MARDDVSRVGCNGPAGENTGERGSRGVGSVGFVRIDGESGRQEISTVVTVNVTRKSLLFTVPWAVCNANVRSPSAALSVGNLYRLTFCRGPNAYADADSSTRETYLGHPAEAENPQG